MSVQYQVVLLDLDGALRDAVYRVVLVLVRHVVRRCGSGVDGVQLAIVVLHDDPGDETSDATEAVDPHAGDRHRRGCAIGSNGLQGGSVEGRVGRGGADDGGEGDGGGKFHFPSRRCL